MRQRKNLLTSAGIEPTTSGLDLPSLCRLSYKVAQRKSGTTLNGESRRLADVQLRLNRWGGSFDNGRALPAMYRERVLDLYHDGFGTVKSHRKFVRAPVLYRK